MGINFHSFRPQYALRSYRYQNNKKGKQLIWPTFVKERENMRLNNII